MFSVAAMLMCVMILEYIVSVEGIHPRASVPIIEANESPINYDPPFLPPGHADTIEWDIPGEPLSPEDFNIGSQMVHLDYDPTSKADPIELAGLYQGDIFLSASEYVNLFQRATVPMPRNAMKDIHQRWDNGVIPYVISAAYSAKERGTIATAMLNYHKITCIRFVPRTAEKDYIHILKGDGCSSRVGKQGGAQKVSLGPGCLYVGIVMHEFMHAAGFWHEQSRADRDNYVTINTVNIQQGMNDNFKKYPWDKIQSLGVEYDLGFWHEQSRADRDNYVTINTVNIQQGMNDNFKKYPWDKIQSLGVEYDLGSVMHYGPYAFAKDRTKPTIIPKVKGVEIGQRRDFSNKDIEKLIVLYNCANTTNIITKAPINIISKDPCEDYSEHCESWSAMGECLNNPTWMNANCKKSCKQCGKECSNESEFCDEWASKNECTANPDYMSKFCKMACGMCHQPSEFNENICEDKNMHCGTWQKQGDCRSNPDYMLIWCRKSCNTCKLT